MKYAIFTIGDEDTIFFEGYYKEDEQICNGHNIPYFKLETVKQMAKRFKDEITIESDGTIRYPDIDPDIILEPERYKGEIVYSLWALGWTWDATLNPDNADEFFPLYAPKVINYKQKMSGQKVNGKIIHFEKDELKEIKKGLTKMLRDLLEE